MANIVFIAVQCCQCSTMQVKQQKKSSNTWTCVVCNQKQSVRKVFARGFMAKDIRKFVQAFNMSRKFVDEDSQLIADCEVSFPGYDSPSAEIEVREKKKKRRVDWNEYMDEDDLHGDELGAGVEGIDGQELEPKIVTEWPDEFSKKPKLKNHDFSHGQCEASYKPVFSKRSRGNDVRSQSRKSKETFTDEGSIHDRGNAVENPKRSEKVQAAKSRPVTTHGGPKWDQYMTENDGKQFSTERNCDWTATNDLNCRYEDDKEVEEDIHPDFL